MRQVRRMEGEAHPARANFAVRKASCEPATPPASPSSFRGMYLRRTFVAWSMEFGAYFIANGFLAWSPTLYMKIGGLPASRAIMPCGSVSTTC